MKNSVKTSPTPVPEWAPLTPRRLRRADAAKNFQKDEMKRARLAAILDDPVFREAQAILEDELKPRGDLAVFLGSETVSAHRYHQVAGMIYFTDGLDRLSTPPKEVKVIQGKSLSTSLPAQ